MAIFDKEKAIEGQKKLCEEKGYPHFAPKSGVCWHCGCNFYEELTREGEKYKTGISVEKARTELMTGCPHCHRSYCD